MADTTKIPAIAGVYTDLIIKGRKTIKSVPKNLVDAVKQELSNRGFKND